MSASLASHGLDKYSIVYGILDSPLKTEGLRGLLSARVVNLVTYITYLGPDNKNRYAVSLGIQGYLILFVSTDMRAISRSWDFDHILNNIVTPKR